MRLHVVHVVHSLRVAGLENGVNNLVNRLNGDVRQTVVCLREAGPLSRTLPAEVEFILAGRKQERDFQLVWRLAAIFRSLRPDIVHSRNWSAADALPAARLARVPTVIHGEHGREASDPDGLNRRRNLIKRMMSPLVTRYVTVSLDLRQWLVTTVGIRPDKIVYIPNGVDTARFTVSRNCSAGERATQRVALGLPPAALIIGTVGRLDPVKDQSTLLEAFARIEDSGRDLALVIVGEGSLRPVLEARIRRPDLAGRVHLLGERVDVPAVLREFELFVLPSIAEGMSNTILEAMASALPVVATRTGGNPELVADGVTGALVPARDSSAMSGALHAYVADAHLRLLHGEAGRQRVIEKFSLDRMASVHLDLYRRLNATRQSWPWTISVGREN